MSLYDAIQAFFVDTYRFLLVGIFLIAAVILAVGLIWAMCVLAARADTWAGRK